MGLFNRDKKNETSPVAPPVPSTGTINGLTKLRGRGFIHETSTGESIFFNSAACPEFDSLVMGQSVMFLKETDPLDRLRFHAIEVRSA